MPRINGGLLIFVAMSINTALYKWRFRDRRERGPRRHVRACGLACGRVLRYHAKCQLPNKDFGKVG